MAKRLTILFAPLDAHGHVNACLGVAQGLARRGHRIVFALDSAWKSKCEQFGFEEEIHTNNNDDQQDEEYWPRYIAEHAQVLRSAPDSKERMEKFILHANVAMFEQHQLRENQVQAIVDRVKPDIIVIDNYFESPALTCSQIPWVLLSSANPIFAILDDRTPPPRSGLPIDGDKKEWKRFSALIEDTLKPLSDQFNSWLKFKGAPPSPSGLTGHRESPYLNIYMFPKELDYTAHRPLPKKWHQFDSFIRETNEIFEIPKPLLKKFGKLIFVSMGSFASADLELMKKLVNILKDSPHRYIISKGILGDRYELPENMWGANFVPQTKVIPLVDLIISHGGNNTVTESFYFGKPMIILPLFGDQFDNAQRLVETRLGKRLDTYNCTAQQLLGAIEELLNDEALAQKMQAISKRIQNAKNSERAASLIEQIIAAPL